MKIRLKDIWCFLGSGLVSIVFFSFCYFRTILLTDLSVAAVLLYTAPSMVIVMSAMFFGEKLTGKKIFAMCLAFIGCVLVTGILGGTSVQIVPAAILSGLGAGLGYALYSIFSRFALEKGYDNLTISFYTFLLAAVGVVPLADIGFIVRTVTAYPGRIGFSFLFSLVTTILPYLFYTWGLKNVENGPASIMASIEPVVATLTGFVVFHETLSPMEMAGVALVLASIVICNIHHKDG